MSEENTLRLRPYKKCDAEIIVSWLKDEAGFMKWSAGQYDHFPISADDMNSYYERFADSDSNFQMTAFDDNGVCGHMIMRFLDEEKQKLRFGFIIVDSSRRGKGYGSGMLKLALKYAFEILKVSEVSLGVFDNNPSAIKCYESVGLKKGKYNEGELKYKDESWRTFDMRICKSDYESMINS